MLNLADNRKNQLDFFKDQDLIQAAIASLSAPPPVAPTIASALASGKTDERVRKPRNNNVEECNACGEEVTMLYRKGKKLAWTEATVIVSGHKRILYWCQECAESDAIQIPDPVAETAKKAKASAGRTPEMRGVPTFAPGVK